MQEGLETAIDAMGFVASKISQHTLDIEIHDKAIHALEVWQQRIVGMFAVIVFEIPIVIGLIYFILKH